jgi:hypothetical protein
MDAVGDIDHHPDEPGDISPGIIERCFLEYDIPRGMICMSEFRLVDLDTFPDQQLGIFLSCKDRHIA